MSSVEAALKIRVEDGEDVEDDRRDTSLLVFWGLVVTSAVVCALIGLPARSRQKVAAVSATVLGIEGCVMAVLGLIVNRGRVSGKSVFNALAAFFFLCALGNSIILLPYL